jgi:tetratricopeptide (TPR) repeat protein
MRPLHWTPRSIAAVIFLLALTLRLWLLAEAAASPYYSTLVLDAEEYQHLARSLLAGTWSSAAAQTYVHGILYPAFWAVVEWCGGGVPALLLLQAALGSLTCVLLYTGARHLLAPTAAVICGVLASLYWPFLLFGAQPLATTLVVFLVAALFACLSQPSAMSDGRLVGAGLLLALVGATRANALLLVPVVAWMSMARFQAAGRNWHRSLLFLCVGLGIGLAPFVAHNMATQGTPLPFEGAWSLHMGNNPDADGTPYARQGIDWQRLETIGFRDGWEATPAQRGRIYLEEAIGFWTGRPLQALLLTYHKVRLFWHAFEVPVSVDLAWFNQHTMLGRMLPSTFGLLAPFALLGMITNRRHWRTWSLGYGGVLAFLISGMLFTVCARYRLPAVPFLLLFAADAMHRIALLFQAGDRRGLVYQGAWLVAATVVVHTGVSPAQADHLRPDWLQGEILSKDDRLPEAESAFLQGLQTHPGDADIHNSLGAMRERLGRPAEAEASYRESLRLAPDHSRAAVNLARLLGRSGRQTEGFTVIATALAVDPRPRLRHEALLCRGILYLQVGDLQAAYQDMHSALEIEDRPQARYNLANVCHQLDRVDEEIGHLERAVQLQPAFAAAHLNLGTLLLMRGQLDTAERSLKQAVTLEPRLATAHAHLGILYQRTGRPDLSRAALNLASRLRSEQGQAPSH